MDNFESPNSITTGELFIYPPDNSLFRSFKLTFDEKMNDNWVFWFAAILAIIFVVGMIIPV